MPWTPRPAQPYQPGNLEAVRHGAFSPRLVEQRASELLAQLRDTEDCKWLTDVDAIQLDTWLKSRARYELLNEYITSMIDQFGVEAGVEKVSMKVWTTVTAQERNLVRLTQDLGLDPTGRAKLLKDLGLAKQFMREGAQKLAAQGSEIRRQRGLRKGSGTE